MSELKYSSDDAMIYGGTADHIVKVQMRCDHDWHGPCIDEISRYYVCKKCGCRVRDCTEEEYYEIVNAPIKDDKPVTEQASERIKMLAETRDIMIMAVRTALTEDALDRIKSTSKSLYHMMGVVWAADNLLTKHTNLLEDILQWHPMVEKSEDEDDGKEEDEDTE